MQCFFFGDVARETSPLFSGVLFLAFFFTEGFPEQALVCDSGVFAREFWALKRPFYASRQRQKKKFALFSRVLFLLRRVFRKVFGHELRQLWWCVFGWFLPAFCLGFCTGFREKFFTAFELPFLSVFLFFSPSPFFLLLLGSAWVPFLLFLLFACRTRRLWKAGRCCTRFASLFLSSFFLFLSGPTPLSPSLLFSFSLSLLHAHTFDIMS